MVDLKRFFSNFFGIFFQFRCHICQNPTEFRQVICFRCRQKLEKHFFKPELISDTCCNFPVYTLSSYDSLIQDVVRIIKYRPSRRLLESLLEILLSSRVLDGFNREGNGIIIPVPMHSERLKTRGFNQADELAFAFSCFISCQYSPVLKRIRATRPQADCNEEERLENLEQAFELESSLKKELFLNQRLIIVDDVATTGTTIQKCAEKLVSLKPSGIVGLVLSHSFRKT